MKDRRLDRLECLVETSCSPSSGACTVRSNMEKVHVSTVRTIRITSDLISHDSQSTSTYGSTASGSWEEGGDLLGRG
jgi:hypothetical protein